MVLMVFVLGLCLGSFVNMAVYRTAVGYGLTSSRSRQRWEWRSPWDCFAALAMTDKHSFCDFCGKQLRIIDNIPVISWLMLKGKSSCCGKKLSVLYPIVEMAMGILFVVYYWIEKGQNNVLSVQFGLGLGVITMLVLAGVFDMKYMILPDWSTGVLVGLAIIRLVIFWASHASPLQYVGAAIGAGGFLGLLYISTRGKGMGLGDVKLAVFMGLWLGWPGIVVAFYVAFVTGAVYGLMLMVAKRANKKSAVPFGPFLIMGTIVSWWFGSGMIKLINELGFKI